MTIGLGLPKRLANCIVGAYHGQNIMLTVGPSVHGAGDSLLFRLAVS